MPTNDEVIGTAEAARLLGISRSTLTRRVQRRQIRTFRKGTGRTGEILFNRADIDALSSPVVPDVSAGAAGGHT